MPILQIDHHTKSVASTHSPQGGGQGVSNFKLDQLLDLNALDDYTNDYKAVGVATTVHKSMPHNRQTIAAGSGTGTH